MGRWAIGAHAMSLHAVQLMTHPITRIVRLFGYLFVGYLSLSKAST